ncbi:hypothetical protein IAS59_005196 [Cryptococcus gattii]
MAPFDAGVLTSIAGARSCSAIPTTLLTCTTPTRSSILASISLIFPAFASLIFITPVYSFAISSFFINRRLDVLF